LKKKTLHQGISSRTKRKANNLVIEVNSMMRMKFLGKKMKLAWNHV